MKRTHRKKSRTRSGQEVRHQQPHIAAVSLRLAGSSGYCMFSDYSRSYPSVLETHEYKDRQSLISDLPTIIAPADEMAEQLRRQSAS